MRIISKFQDYYDCGLAMGQDDEIVYVRKREESSKRVTGWYHGRHDRFVERVYLIGFCGKIYPLITLTRIVREGTYNNRWNSEEETVFCYSVEDLNECVERFGIRSGKNSRRYEYSEHSRMAKNFTANWIKDRKNWWYDYKTPIWVECIRSGDRTEPSLVINPCLKDYKFFRVFDAYTAFQEINMFVGGVLGTAGADTVEIGDEYRLAGHGYNKESFRMSKGAKPNRKNR
jgi:hypothetical protein